MWVYLAGRYSRREELLGYAAEIDRAGHETCSTWIAGSHELPEGWDQADPVPPERQRPLRGKTFGTWAWLTWSFVSPTPRCLS